MVVDEVSLLKALFFCFFFLNIFFSVIYFWRFGAFGVLRFVCASKAILMYLTILLAITFPMAFLLTILLSLKTFFLAFLC